MIIKIPSDQGDDPAPGAERLPALFVNNKINISLAIALFDIREPVKFLREGAYRLAEKGEGINPDGNLSQFRAENMTGNPDNISPFDELVEQIELLVPDIVLPDIELDLSGLVPEVGKEGFSMVPYNIYPSGSRHRFSALVMSDISITGLNLEHRMLPVV
jgi:hypothetical protein